MWKARAFGSCLFLSRLPSMCPRGMCYWLGNGGDMDLPSRSQCGRADSEQRGTLHHECKAP